MQKAVVEGRGGIGVRGRGTVFQGFRFNLFQSYGSKKPGGLSVSVRLHHQLLARGEQAWHRQAFELFEHLRFSVQYAPLQDINFVDG